MSRDPIGMLMRSPVGAAVARPWFDRVALRFLARRYCSLSRAWAAAVAAEGSVERFLAETPVAGAPSRIRARLPAALVHVDRLKRIARSAEARWRDAAFGPDPFEGARLEELETARRGAAHALMATRARFAFLLGQCPIPPPPFGGRRDPRERCGRRPVERRRRQARSGQAP